MRPSSIALAHFLYAIMLAPSTVSGELWPHAFLAEVNLKDGRLKVVRRVSAGFEAESLGAQAPPSLARLEGLVEVAGEAEAETSEAEEAKQQYVAVMKQRLHQWRMGELQENDASGDNFGLPDINNMIANAGGESAICRRTAPVTTLAVPQCKPLPARTSSPTSAKDLRPDDIRLIMTVGDSMSLGSFLHNDICENLGDAWPSGGDDRVVSIPYLMNHVGHNNDLMGQTHGSIVSELTAFWVDKPWEQKSYTNKQLDKYRGLNAAFFSAQLFQVPFQVDRLIEKLNTPEYAKHKDSWKLVNMWVGGSEYPMSHPEAEMLRLDVRKALHQIHSRIPNVFVNVIAYPEQWLANEKLNTLCKLYNTRGKYLLGADPSEGFSATGLGLKRLNKLYEEEISKLQSAGNSSYHFAFQTFFRDHKLKSDMFDPFTCFHPSLETSEHMSVALWNSMLSTGEKPRFIDMAGTPVCPDEDSRLH